MNSLIWGPLDWSEKREDYRFFFEEDLELELNIE